MNPNLLRYGMNIWPPFWGAGIRVEKISQNYREVSVRLRLGILNRNAMGVHFGGSLFAMADPFYMIMVAQNVGKSYVVWDQAAKIEFIKPGRGIVRAHFVLTQVQIDDILLAASTGKKVLRDFEILITDGQGDVVARITKTIYIRKKQVAKSLKVA